MLDLKNSPLSKTPTKLPVIPGVTLDDDGKIIEEEEEANENERNSMNKQVKAVPMEEQNGTDPKKSHGKLGFCHEKLCILVIQKYYKPKGAAIYLF